MYQQSFLNYYQEVLSKVSFEDHLFRKEYKKALNYIEPRNHEKLNRWLEEKGVFKKLNMKIWKNN